MNRARLALCTMLSVVACGTSASAQRAPSAPLPERLGASARAAIERLADSLQSERLPAHALRDKAAEGALKGAEDARILVAVQSLAARLRDARRALGDDATDDELLAASSALFAGVSTRELSRLARSLPPTSQPATSLPTPSARSLGMALTVLAELAASRVPSDLAVSSLSQLLGRGARDDDMLHFRRSVEQSLRSGRSPRDAIDASVQRTLQGMRR